MHHRRTLPKGLESFCIPRKRQSGVPLQRVACVTDVAAPSVSGQGEIIHRSREAWQEMKRYPDICIIRHPPRYGVEAVRCRRGAPSTSYTRTPNGISPIIQQSYQRIRRLTRFSTAARRDTGEIWPKSPSWVLWLQRPYTDDPVRLFRKEMRIILLDLAPSRHAHACAPTRLVCSCTCTMVPSVPNSSKV